MAEVHLSVHDGCTVIQVHEDSRQLGHGVPQLLGIAVRRICDALGGDRHNTVQSVVEAMGVHVECIE